MLLLCFKLPSCLLGNTRDTSVMYEKAKFVCFILMQPQKVKFKFVQINTKQVSYNDDYDLTVRMPILVRAFVLRLVNLSADSEVSDDFFQCTARTLI